MMCNPNLKLRKKKRTMDESVDVGYLVEPYKSFCVHM